LVELFRFAQTKGPYPADQKNPAEVTYAKSDYGKQRGYRPDQNSMIEGFVLGQGTRPTAFGNAP